MTRWNIYNKHLWRISGGRYPTLYIAKTNNNSLDPLDITELTKIPVPPLYARDENTPMRIIKDNIGAQK